jgi:hypothetical protein
LSPETREKLAALRKEFLQKKGETGHEDLTDEEWKRKWANVVAELKEKLVNEHEVDN